MILRRLAVSLGFLGFTGAVVIAHYSPATGYELSIYTATPALYWVGVALALVLGVFGLTSDEESGFLSTSAGLLLCLAVLSVAGLPLIRGYYYYGQFDALTQLGLAYEIYHAKSNLFVYPLYHSISVEIASITGLPIRHGLLVALVLGMGLYAGSVPFVASWLAPDGRKVRRIGLLVAFIGVPIMTVRLPQFAPIPNMMAALIWPLSCGCYLAWSQTRESKWGFATLLLSLATILAHPTAAVALSLLLVTHAFALYLIDRERVRLWDSSLPLPLAITTISFVWITSFQGKVSEFTTDWQVESEGPGSQLSEAGESLSQIGISLSELFLKIVLVKLFLATLAIAFCLWILLRYVRLSDLTDIRERTALAFGIGAVPIGLVILVFFALGISNQYSRYIGLSLGVIAPLAAVAIYTLIGRTSGSTGRRYRLPRRALVVAVAVCMLSSSVLIIHASPWVVRPTKHVTQQQMVGYETSIAYGDEDVQFVGAYSEPRRTLNAYYGSKPGTEVGSNRTWRRNAGEVADYTEGDLHTYNWSSKYLIVTEYGRKVHTELYRGVTYDAEDFSRLRYSTRADRVYTNGEFDLYLFE